MSAKTRANLVLVEPGVTASPALGAATDQNHLLFLGADEPLAGFQERVRRRASAMKRSSQELCEVIYLVGSSSNANWHTRQQLLAELCDEVEPQGSVALHAPSSALTDVFSCIQDLSTSVAPGVSLRAVFTDVREAVVA